MRWTRSGLFPEDILIPILSLSLSLSLSLACSGGPVRRNARSLNGAKTESNYRKGSVQRTKPQDSDPPLYINSNLSEVEGPWISFRACKIFNLKQLPKQPPRSPEKNSYRLRRSLVIKNRTMVSSPGHQDSPKALYSMVFGPKSLNI